MYFSLPHLGQKALSEMWVFSQKCPICHAIADQRLFIEFHIYCSKHASYILLHEIRGRFIWYVKTVAVFVLASRYVTMCSICLKKVDGLLHFREMSLTFKNSHHSLPAQRDLFSVKFKTISKIQHSNINNPLCQWLLHFHPHVT